MNIHFLVFFFLYINTVYGASFNITDVLSKYPDFSTFNSYLSQTKVAATINSQGTITVLAVSNANVGSLSGKSNDELSVILSLHGLLDLFTPKRLQTIQNNSMVTTLYQKTGLAKGQQGFLNITVSSNKDVYFGSAAPGSSAGSKLVASITSLQTLSVLQIDNAIIPGTPGSATTTPPSSSSPPTPAPASSPGKTPNPVPTPGKSPSKSPSASPPSPPAPTPAKSPAPAPSNSSDTPAPSTAPSPANASTPSPSPSPSPSETPTSAPAPGPDAAADTPSLGTHLGHNLGAMLVMILTNVWLFAMF